MLLFLRRRILSARPPLLHSRPKPPHSRQSSTSPPPPPPPPQSSPSPPSKFSTLLSRLPKRLQPLLQPLHAAPLSHITAFLLLHELTAIIPLFGLAATFHYTDWLPGFFAEGKWVSEGVEKFGKWMRKKGWIDGEEVELLEQGGEGMKGEKRRKGWYGTGEQGVKVVVELATAYAVTKALLPVRLGVSVWATPWFARGVVLPVTRRVGGVFGRGKRVGNGAGSGAVEGGVRDKVGR